jgi:hypothetical protein
MSPGLSETLNAPTQPHGPPCARSTPRLLLLRATVLTASSASSRLIFSMCCSI